MHNCEPKVSVVSVFYNRADTVYESVESLVKQSLSDIEIILVDDGSTDSTFFELEKFKDDPRVKIVSHSNMGFVKSINHAINIAKAKYIAIHGSGDYSFKDRLKFQYEFLNANIDYAAVGCHVESRDLCSGFVKKIYSEPDASNTLNNKIVKCNVYTHGEVMYRRDAFEKVGRYRDFFKFCQDYDLWLRFSEYYKLGNIDKKLYRRYVRSDGVSGDLTKRELQLRLSYLARMNFLKKRTTGIDFIQKYGEYAPLLLSNSFSSNKANLKLSLLYYYRKDFISALKKVNDITGLFSLGAMIWKVVIYLSKNSNFIYSITKKIINKVSLSG